MKSMNCIHCGGLHEAASNVTPAHRRIGGLDEPTRTELLAAVDKHVAPFQSDDALVLVSRLVANLAQRERYVERLKEELTHWKNRACTAEGTIRAHGPRADETVHRRVQRSLAKAVEGARAAERERTIEAAANFIEAHSCVSTCCKAQPGADTARALATCLRKNAR